jgi:hypothetical protein
VTEADVAGAHAADLAAQGAHGLIADEIYPVTEHD